MESEKTEEKTTSEPTQVQTSSDILPTTEVKKETTELTQEKKDTCKIIFLIFICIL